MKQATCQVMETEAPGRGSPDVDSAASEFFTVREVTKRLRQKSTFLVLRLIREGQLRAIYVGKSFLIPKASLEAFLKSAEVTA